MRGSARFRGGRGEQIEEFFSAEAEQQSVRFETVKRLRHSPQAFVSCNVTEGIVVLLEAINIDHEDRHGSLFNALEEAGDPFIEVVSVKDARKRVVIRYIIQLFCLEQNLFVFFIESDAAQKLVPQSAEPQQAEKYGYQCNTYGIYELAVAVVIQNQMKPQKSAGEKNLADYIKRNGKPRVYVEQPADIDGGRHIDTEVIGHALVVKRQADSPEQEDAPESGV